MQSLNLEITKYDSNVNGDYKVQNQLSFSVENIRTMEDWQELVGRVGDIVFNLNSKFEPVSGSYERANIEHEFKTIPNDKIRRNRTK